MNQTDSVGLHTASTQGDSTKAGKHVQLLNSVMQLFMDELVSSTQGQVFCHHSKPARTKTPPAY